MASIEPHQLENSFRAAAVSFHPPRSDASSLPARSRWCQRRLPRLQRRDIFLCAGHPRGSTEASSAEGVCAEHLWGWVRTW
ncbi:hypothetical protein KC320_g98 [Hortaea werneckii]|nr:hypothetical protein KC320_g98 [Hortaea werneckii]